MPNSRTAKARLKTNLRNFERNRARKSRIKTFLRKLDDALKSQDVPASKAAFKDAQKELHTAVSKGLFHKNTVARKLSRLSARVKALDQKSSS